MTLENDIVNLWSDLFPIEAYKAGFPQCQGRLFQHSDENIRRVQANITALQSRLDEISEADLHFTADKLLRCFRTQMEFSLPPSRVYDCAEGVYAILLKGDQGAAFIPAFLADAARLVQEETTRWRDCAVSVELRKLALNSAVYLQDTLNIMGSENPDVSDACHSILLALENYTALFNLPGLERNDFESLYPLLQRHQSSPRALPEYPRLLRDLYDYPETAGEIRQKGLDWLEAEMPLVREIAGRVAQIYNLPADAQIEQVHKIMNERNKVGADSLAESRQMMEITDRYTIQHILELRPEDQVEMEATPGYLEPLGTEGSLLSLDYLTAKPRRICYITPTKNESRLTMLNVLVHEYGHGFHESLTGRLASSQLLKIVSPLMYPLTEAIAFHREWEFWEAAAALITHTDLTSEDHAYLSIFGSDQKTRSQTIQAFELETRFWRVARFLRILGDVEAHLGLRTHVDFVEWAHARTGLSKEFIHNAIFTFLKSPGYAPCYAIAGIKLGELQQEAMARGISRREFNTRVSSMGYWPRTVYEMRLDSIA